MGDRKLLEIEQNGRKIVLYGSSHGDTELYIDGVHGIAFGNAVAKINLYTSAPFPDEGHAVDRRDVVARLVMSLATFVSVARFLSSQVDELVNSGAIQVDQQRQTEETN